MARRHQSQEERDQYDERRLKWFLRAQDRALSWQELAEITGIPANRVLGALDRLSDDGIVRSDGSNHWRMSRANETKRPIASFETQ